ncbi:Integrase catalytic domain-containing protein, partial [Aphis craccivora]
LSKLTSNIPIKPINLHNLKIPDGIELADPLFMQPQKIDMILGAGVFFDLLCQEQNIKNYPHKFIFQKTQLGWIVCGRIFNKQFKTDLNTQIALFTLNNTENDINIGKKISKFWELEECSSDNIYTLEEINFVKLKDSRSAALRRFKLLERRFSKNPLLHAQYVHFMQEYASLGYMELVDTEHEINTNEYFLPHHAVEKLDSVQQELVCILARFRTHYYALSADTTKMYRQIWLNEEHTNYQKIFWRENPNLPLSTYRLKTITYGTTPASYLATGCLNKLADEEFNNYPVACEAIISDFCVDDYLGGASSKETALQLRNDLIKVTRKAGFELRKWVSNDNELLNDMPNEDNTQLLVLNLRNDVTKILELIWNTQITLYKLFMQKIWQMKLTWDDQLPKNLVNEWQKYMSNLHLLNNLKIPRCIMGSGNIHRLEIHGFSNASIVAYGACLYLKTINERQECNVRLICAKSRVAPLKTISLPRLELCGAQLLARLSNKIITKLNIQINEKYFWTDSTVTLSWIKSSSGKWKTFVAHRVGEIQSLTCTSEWYHVRTKDNPADVISRGCTPNDISNQLWWEGPIWLKLNKEMWPKDITKHDESQEVLEVKQCTQIFSVQVEDPILEKYSSFSKLLRTISLCLQLIQVDELRTALVVLIKIVQKSNWSQGIKDLQKYNQVSEKSKLRYLKPFIDDNGVIRVGVRLNNAASISVFQRHPMLLPANSHLTTLLFRYEHIRLLHAGP